ncbi:MAG TPA: phosphate acyltransferase [Gemmatimonadales bacterium]|nr:phosphate acyltransferase [Gemmatimonadales bacterium]
MSFRARVFERARAANRRIVLPEGGDPRVRAAGEKLARDGIARVEVLDDVAGDARAAACAAHLRRRRPDKFPDDASAREAVRHPLTLGACLVGIGAADVMVGGALYTTADTIRAALLAVGTAPGIHVVSGAFYMIHEERVLTFADCAAVPEPDPQQLAEIALATARDRRRIVGDEPVVAFLSYSTKGSAEGPRVERVRRAVAALAAQRPDFPFDGELQGDAALVEAIGARKAPGSRAAGRANVLIFPDLDAANIGYKLVQRLGGWDALGPVLQGLARPVSDLSRGASVDDIVATAAVATLQVEGT